MQKYHWLELQTIADCYSSEIAFVSQPSYEGALKQKMDSIPNLKWNTEHGFNIQTELETNDSPKELILKKVLFWLLNYFGIYIQNPQITRENPRVGMPNKHSEITAPVKP